MTERTAPERRGFRGDVQRPGIARRSEPRFPPQGIEPSELNTKALHSAPPHPENGLMHEHLVGAGLEASLLTSL